MELSPYQQIYELVKKSNKIVIALPRKPSTDAIASGLGLFLCLEKMKKSVTVVCNQFELPPYHQFLPKSKEILSDLTTLRKFIIHLDLTKTKVKELSYDITDDKLNVYITPKSGFYDPRDITTSASRYEYELIFVLDSSDLESLGTIYDENAEFFYHMPIINIDHKPTNEYFGQINLVDLVATSTSELVFELVKEFKEKLMDEYIATSLLTGIISKTKSFQSATVTPKSLAIASHLIEQGARRDEIIKNLFRTKSISTLKLWGRALARLKMDLDGRVIWSMLARQDFDLSGANCDDLEGVVDELIINTPNAEIVMLLCEKKEKKIEAVVNTIKSINGLELFNDFKPRGTINFARFEIEGKNIVEAEELILQKIKEYYGKL